MLLPPISVREFLQLLHKCRPPGSSHWTGPMAVANSGGPDSMCLLYLLSKTIEQFGSDGGLPSEVYSIHVDHGLQAANEYMKEKVSAFCRSLKVKDVQLSIPWGASPFPPRPQPGVAFEETARDARSHLVFHYLRGSQVRYIAYGHHADDQVETVLMRLMHGSGELGTAGMRRTRRWGMGSSGRSELGFAGVAGFYKWIVRPFLDVPKSRVLATCEANGIDYVTDPSNFQPDLTYRNYIRANLATRSHPLTQEQSNTMGFTAHVVFPSIQFPAASVPADIPPVSSPLGHAINKLQAISGTNDLYEAVRRTNEAQSRIDNLVTQRFKRLSSTVRNSRFMFKPSDYQDITDPILRIAFVRRILQYISPHPWGSTAAEAHGSKASLDRIVDNIWNTNIPILERRPFSAGGKVLWTPVLVHSNTEFTIPSPSSSQAPPKTMVEGEPAWIAHRAPPSSRDNDQIIGRIHGAALLRSPISFLYLWDNRMNVVFYTKEFMAALSPITIRPTSYILVEPKTRWCLPRVTLHTEGKEILLGSWEENVENGVHGAPRFKAYYAGIASGAQRRLFPGTK